MRVCLVSQEYPPETGRGGIGSQSFLRAHGLSALGHDVTVLSHSLDSDCHYATDGPVKIIRIPNKDHQMQINTDSVRWLSYSLEVASALQSIHQQTPLDLIVFPEWGGEGYAYLLNRTELNPIPTIVHIHGSISMFAELMGWPEKDSEFFQTGTEMERTSLRLADSLSSSSVFSAEWCRKYYGLKRDFIPVLHTGIDTELFAPRLVPKQNQPTLIFVGHIADNKGVDILTEAACRLREEFPGLKLQMIGKGQDSVLKKIKKITEIYQAKDLIEFPGYVQRKDLPDYLSKAHVFAAPSLFEGGPGNVYLEAMACGIPVIASKDTGAAEVVTEGQTGFLIPKNDTRALVNFLRKILSDPSLQKKMGQAARQYVLDHADSHVCLKKLEQFYVSIASGGKKTALEGICS